MKINSQSVDILKRICGTSSIYFDGRAHRINLEEGYEKKGDGFIYTLRGSVVVNNSIVNLFQINTISDNGEVDERDIEDGVFNFIQKIVIEKLTSVVKK